MSFAQNLLVWIFLVSMWVGVVVNSLPLLITDGYYLLASTLYGITGRRVIKPILIFSIGFLLTITVVLLVERVLIPYNLM